MLLLMTSRNLLQKKKKKFDCMYYPFIKIIYIFTFPSSSLEQFFRIIWGAISRDVGLTFSSMKLNWKLSLCDYFKSKICIL